MPKIEETKNYVRIRQIEPKKFDKQSFRTLDIGRSGYSKIIVACPRGSYDSKKKVCKVGLRVQSVILNKQDFGNRKEALAYYNKYLKGI